MTRPRTAHIGGVAGHGDGVGHLAAAVAAVVTATAGDCRWLLMADRGDGHGWTLPESTVEPGETPVETARRTLAEQTTLAVPGLIWHQRSPQPVPQHREPTRARVAIACCLQLGGFDTAARLPAVTGGRSACRAVWVQADSYATLRSDLQLRFGGQVSAAQQDLLGELLDGPDDTELWLRDHVAEELGGRTADELRDLAENWLRLRAAIEMTMPDIGDWSDDEGSVRVPQLIDYLGHLTRAHHGSCHHCRRLIGAPHAVTELPARPAWHPGRWWEAAREVALGLLDAWRVLRYGDDRLAHTSCRPRRHWS